MREYAYYTQVLKDQLIPATGCTEPIALAYGAAMAYRTLGAEPERITAAVSGSIIKNVKSVVVPKTGGMKGIETAIAAGVVAGNPDLELEVLSGAPENTGRWRRNSWKSAPLPCALRIRIGFLTFRSPCTPGSTAPLCASWTPTPMWCRSAGTRLS